MLPLCVRINDETTDKFGLVSDVCANKTTRESNLSITIDVYGGSFTLVIIGEIQHELHSKKITIQTTLGSSLPSVRESSLKLSINTPYLLGVYIKTFTNGCSRERSLHEYFFKINYSLFLIKSRIYSCIEHTWIELTEFEWFVKFT